MIIIKFLNVDYLKWKRNYKACHAGKVFETLSKMWIKDFVMCSFKNIHWLYILKYLKQILKTHWFNLDFFFQFL